MPQSHWLLPGVVVTHTVITALAAQVRDVGLQLLIFTFYVLILYMPNFASKHPLAQLKRPVNVHYYPKPTV